MFCIYFGEVPKNYSDALKLDSSKFSEFFSKMLKEGIFLPPSQYETCFMSVAHSDEDIEKTVEVARACLRKL
jgi:glutamate-1-semialdehyde 2,1-aminomutase